MKRILGIAFASVILVIPSAARADWVEVAQSRNGAFVRVDESSLERYGNKVVYIEYSETTQDRLTMRVAADCQTGQYQPLEAIANGVRTYPPHGKFPIMQSTLGSLRSAAIQFACSSH